MTKQAFDRAGNSDVPSSITIFVVQGLHPRNGRLSDSRPFPLWEGDPPICGESECDPFNQGKGGDQGA